MAATKRNIISYISSMKFMFVSMNAAITPLFVIGFRKVDDHDSRAIAVPARPAASLPPTKGPPTTPLHLFKKVFKTRFDNVF